MEWAMRQKLPSVTKLVLTVIAFHHNHETGRCDPGKQAISRMAGIGKRTADDHVSKLAVHGLLLIAGRCGRSQTNTYTINFGCELCLIGPSNECRTCIAKGAGAAPFPEIKGAGAAPFPEEKGADDDKKRCSSRQEKVQELHPNKEGTRKEQGSAQAQKCATAQSQGMRFPEFWQAYPKKRDRRKAEQVWKSHKLDGKASMIIADVRRRLAEDRQWQDVQFIPYPTTYLRNRRWEDDIEPRRDNDESMEPQPDLYEVIG